MDVGPVSEMLAGKIRSYENAVLVEYPRKDVYRISFVMDENVIDIGLEITISLGDTEE